MVCNKVTEPYKDTKEEYEKNEGQDVLSEFF
jgi:hypothetical protein